MQNESDGVASKKNQFKCWKAGEARKRREQNIFCSLASRILHFDCLCDSCVIHNSDSDGVVGANQPLQQSHRGDMDNDDGFHPAARPPFVCGLIYVSAVTSSAEQA